VGIFSKREETSNDSVQELVAKTQQLADELKTATAQVEKFNVQELTVEAQRLVTEIKTATMQLGSALERLDQVRKDIDKSLNEFKTERRRPVGNPPRPPRGNPSTGGNQR
jgi:DNA gyrase/topoisomerase IV subunit A